MKQTIRSQTRLQRFLRWLCNKLSPGLGCPNCGDNCHWKGYGNIEMTHGSGFMICCECQLSRVNTDRILSCLAAWHWPEDKLQQAKQGIIRHNYAIDQTGAPPPYWPCESGSYLHQCYQDDPYFLFDVALYKTGVSRDAHLRADHVS